MRLPSFFIKMQFILLPVLASAFPGKAEEADAEPSRYGVTCFSVNFLREQPDFPRELGNQLLMGTPVEITGQEGYWMQVVSPDPYKAWCVEMGIAEMTGEELQDYIAAPKYIVTAEYSHVFSSPFSLKNLVIVVMAIASLGPFPLRWNSPISESFFRL